MRVVSVVLNGGRLKVLMFAAFCALAWLTALASPARATDGQLDSAFNGNVGSTLSNEVSAIALQADGKVVVAGSFDSPSGLVARFESNGTPDDAFNTAVGSSLGSSGEAAGVAVQSDGKIVVVGNSDQSGFFLARFNADGSADSEFNTQTEDVFDARPYGVAIQSDGKIVVGGRFSTPANRIARFDADGSPDTDFNAQVSGIVSGVNAYSLAVQPDGKIVVGGNLSSPARHLFRLNSDGTSDTAFNANIGTSFNDWVRSVALQPDGKIVISGDFTDPAYRIARFDSDGNADAAFNSNVEYIGGNVYAVAVRNDGKIAFGGAFDDPVNNLGQLNADGTSDNDFNRAVGGTLDNYVYALSAQPDGKLLVGGAFNISESSDYLARLGGAPLPLVWDVQRVGANPIVAGGSGTEFKITTTNPNDSVGHGYLFGRLDDGLVMESVEGQDWFCETQDQTFACDLNPFPAKATLDISVKAKAAPWVTAPTLDVCTFGGIEIFKPRASMLSAAREVMAAQPNCGVGGRPNAAVRAAVVGKEKLASVDVVRQAQLVLTASSPERTDPGANATVTFTLRNDGPSSTTYPVTVRGTLPDGLSFVSASAPWQCTVSGQDVECVLAPDNRAVSAASPDFPPLTWTLGTAKPGTVASYPLVVQASMAGMIGEPLKVEPKVPVTPVVYELTKTAGGPYRIGDTVDWTLTVSNTGTIDDAGQITVTDQLPSALKFVSATGDGWSCAASGQKVTCSRVGLAKGATSTATVTTKVVAAGSLKNQASLSTQSYDSASSVTSASDSVRALRAAQSAATLPVTPFRITSGKTEQGQKITTTVRCRPFVAGAAGEVALCRVSRKGDVVRVKVLGERKVVVRVVQRAPGTKRYRPFVATKKYIVNP